MALMTSHPRKKGGGCLVRGVALVMSQEGSGRGQCTLQLPYVSPFVHVLLEIMICTYILYLVP